MKPAMKPNELGLYRDYLNKADKYVESGCGGTTLLAVASSAKRIDVVETDSAWIEKLKDQPSIAEAVQSGRLNFHNTDIGDVIQWGIPKDRSKVTNWPFFSLGFWNEIDGPADFVFVDGRFRVATCIAAMVMCSPDTSMMLHDFAGREQYLPLLDIVDPVEQVDTALTFKRKKSISDADLILAWTRFMYDAR